MTSWWGKAAFVALALILGACAKPSAPPPPSPSAAELAAARRHMFGIALQLGKHLVLPAEFASQATEGEFTIGLLLAPNGELLDARIVGSTDARLNDAALQAAWAASPFPPIPAEIKKDRVWLTLPIMFRRTSSGKKVDVTTR